MTEEKDGLDGRHRDKEGTIRKKSGNTLISTLRGPVFKADCHEAYVLRGENSLTPPPQPPAPTAL